jgi:hypothetical protein
MEALTSFVMVCLGGYSTNKYVNNYIYLHKIPDLSSFKEITMARLQKTYFTANGSWICPAGVTEIIVIGCGGGGGGCGGQGGINVSSTSNAGGGGGGALQSVVYLTVVPNQVYTITIGAGGAASSGTAGGGSSSSTPTNGLPGTETTFDVLATFSGASGGTISSATSPATSSIKLSAGATVASNMYLAACNFVACGAKGNTTIANSSGVTNNSGTGAFTPGQSGNLGTFIGSHLGGGAGGGGGAGPQGSG